MNVKESDAPPPFDSVPNARNKWQFFRGNRVFGRWRHEDGKKGFVCGPPTVVFTKVFVAAASKK
jgi:hypothetical protein